MTIDIIVELIFAAVVICALLMIGYLIWDYIRLTKEIRRTDEEIARLVKEQKQIENLLKTLR